MQWFSEMSELDMKKRAKEAIERKLIGDKRARRIIRRLSVLKEKEYFIR